jgi:hypothetical protein
MQPDGLLEQSGSEREEYENRIAYSSQGYRVAEFKYRYSVVFVRLISAKLKQGAETRTLANVSAV